MVRCGRGSGRQSFNWKGLSFSSRSKNPCKSLSVAFVRHLCRAKKLIDSKPTLDSTPATLSSPLSPLPSHREPSAIDPALPPCSFTPRNGPQHAALCRRQPVIAGRPPCLHHTAPFTPRQQSSLDPAASPAPDRPAPVRPEGIERDDPAKGQEGRLPCTALDMAARVPVCHRRSGLRRVRHLRDAQPR